jgi:S1-C subfamily serine protease
MVHNDIMLYGGTRRRHFFYVSVCLVAVFLLACGSSAVADTAGGGDDFRADENEIEASLAEAMSLCVVYLDDTTSNKYITGTLLYSAGPVIVTNYHILSSSTDTVRAYLSTPDNRIEKFCCTFIKGDRLKDIAVFRVQVPDKYGDRLIVKFGETVSKGGVSAANRCLTADYYADPALIRRGYRVVFLGFPLNYGLAYDEHAGQLIKQPVFRSGRIATEIINGEFLIDAMVSNGNSGSPVFVRTGGREAPARSPAYLLIGIIKEYQHDSIKMHLEGRVVEIPHNTGLGVVIPVDEVKRFLNGLQ